MSEHVSNKRLQVLETFEQGPAGQIRQRRSSFTLYEYDELPLWLQDNHFIRGSYRSESSWYACIKSMFRLHNETLNVWTHLIGAVVFAFLLFYVLSYVSPHAVDRNISPISSDQVKRLRSFIEVNFEGAYAFLGSAKDKAMKSTSEKLKGLADFLHRIEKPMFSSLFHEYNSFTSIGKTVESTFNNMTQFIKQKWNRTSSENMQDAVKSILSVKDHAFVVTNSTFHEIFHILHSLDRQQLEDILLGHFDGNETVEYLTRKPLVLFLVSAFCCLLFSAIYHLFFCQSKEMTIHFQRLDYFGICFLISGTSCSAIYYAFYCQPFYQRLYMSMSSVLPFVAMFMSFSEFMMRPRFAAFRGAFFTFLGVSVSLPMIHFTANLGDVTDFILLLVVGGVFYIVGAFFYGSRFPECSWPGSFDIWFQSHTIFHICVVIAALLHYFALIKFYEWRFSQPCSAVVE